MSRRTGRLVLLSQVLLGDLKVGVRPSVEKEILQKVWPALEQQLKEACIAQHSADVAPADELDDATSAEIYEASEDLIWENKRVQIPRTRAQRIAASLLLYKKSEADENTEDELEEKEEAEEDEDDGSEYFGRSGPLWEYKKLGLSPEVLSLVAQVRDRLDPGACRIADPIIGGGLEHVFFPDPEEDEWIHQPIGAEILVAPIARTIGITLDLQKGGQEDCLVLPAGPVDDRISDDEALNQLEVRVAPRIAKTIGGEAFLKNGRYPAISVLVTSIAAMIAHKDVRRVHKKDQQLVMTAYYSDMLDQLELGTSKETARRILEHHHPRRIDLDLVWPAGSPGAISRPCSLLDRWNEKYLIPRPRLSAILEGKTGTAADRPGKPGEDHVLVIENSPDRGGPSPLSINTINSSYRKRGNGSESGETFSASRARVEQAVDQILDEARRKSPTFSLANYEKGVRETHARKILRADQRHLGGSVETPGSFQSHPPAGSTPPRYTIDPAWLHPEEPLDTIRAGLDIQKLQLALEREDQPGTGLGLIYEEYRQISGLKLKDLVRAWEKIHDQRQPIASARQYVFVAQVLRREFPGLYASVLKDISNGEALPPLFDYTRLAKLKGIVENLDGAEKLRAMGLVLLSERGLPRIEDVLAIEHPKEVRKLTRDVDALGRALEAGPMELGALMRGVFDEQIQEADALARLRRMEAPARELAEAITELRRDLEAKQKGARETLTQPTGTSEEQPQHAADSAEVAHIDDREEDVEVAAGEHGVMPDRSDSATSPEPGETQA